ncbi:helix-turn-helix domain-containing protein [Nocardia sp. NBC_00508]|uniref:AraC family transcriptional regulator n=1 Tax=Nocardia sp. NBC_00508 TaxID=2975992 RepID=UPI002E8215D9|nr:helix-turn-helix domain-containing protein [Nocardia sp. NBC_00508]WUD65614.1 helix-turn-helix domain-containing protein [Nocardia sp. NBC_00508]
MTKALVTNGFSTAPDGTADEPPTGAALLRPGVLACTGAIGPTELHAHHAVQIIAARTPIVVVDGSGVRKQGTHVIVPTDAPHRIDVGSAHGTAVYLDPETAAGAAADRRAHVNGWADSADTLGLAAVEGDLATQVGAVVEDLLPQRHATGTGERHAVVTAALQLLPTLVRTGSVRGADVARQLGVPAPRLTQLFSEQMGIPLRRYILWLRLHIARTRALAGEDLTVAAQAAGFSDDADLARTCRRTFGLPPSALSGTGDGGL